MKDQKSECACGLIPHGTNLMRCVYCHFEKPICEMKSLAEPICFHCQPSQKETEEAVPDRLLEILSGISEIKGKPKIELLLFFLQEIGGMLHHLASIGSSWGADVKQDRVAKSMEYYLQKVEEIKFLILQEYERTKPTSL